MELQVIFLTLGALFLIGLIADQVGRRTRLPRVTLLLLCGIAVGRSGLDLLPTETSYWYEFLTIAALTMVAFLLGSSLSMKNLRKHGAMIMAISLAVVIVTIAVVGAGLWAIGIDPGLALLLGVIATATDPAATQDVIRQAKVRGSFAKTLAGIVAIDDAWGVLAFSLILILVGVLNGGEANGGLLDAAWEIGGAVALGCVLGWPGAYLTGRLAKGEPLQTEALGVVFLCAGLSLWLDVSFLIAGMTAGAVIVNFASHHSRAFHEIEHIQWPFMILFFILAGALLDVSSLGKVGLIGFGYVFLRIISRIIGGWIGAVISGAPRVHRPWFGMALLPQAGVAVGIAMIAAEEFPVYSETILAVTIGTTVLFELIGPAATLIALRKTAAMTRRPPRS
ncbi:MAG: cation:proton antiporter [Hyphomicrobiales bacterium]|nr:cation:proton antiporter [Hyphomicrobiales bacterium]